MKKTVSLFLCLAIICLTGCSAKTKETVPAENAAGTQQAAQDETASGADQNTAPDADRKVTDEDQNAVSEADRNVDPGAISLADAYDYYQRQIEETVQLNAEGRNQETAQFNLYDLDGDGVPELFLNGGYKTNAYEEGIRVFSYSAGKGGWQTGAVDSAALSFYDTVPGDGEINAICVHHGRIGELCYRLAEDGLTETAVTDWHDAEGDEYAERVEAVKDTLVMDGDWLPLEDAASHFSTLRQ